MNRTEPSFAAQLVERLTPTIEPPRLTSHCMDIVRALYRAGFPTHAVYFDADALNAVVVNPRDGQRYRVRIRQVEE